MSAFNLSQLDHEPQDRGMGTSGRGWLLNMGVHVRMELASSMYKDVMPGVSGCQSVTAEVYYQILQSISFSLLTSTSWGFRLPPSPDDGRIQCRQIKLSYR